MEKGLNYLPLFIIHSIDFKTEIITSPEFNLNTQLPAVLFAFLSRDHKQYDLLYPRAGKRV